MNLFVLQSLAIKERYKDTCSRSLRSTDQKLLAVPKSRLKTYGDRAFSVAAPKLWNELPLNLRSLDTINLFKNT